MLHLEFKWYFTLTKKQSCRDKGSWCYSCHCGSDVANVYGRSSRHGQMAAVQKTQHECPAERPLQAKSFMQFLLRSRDRVEAVCQAEPSCRFVINCLWLTEIYFLQQCYLNATHHPSWQPLRCMSILRSAMLTQPHQGSLDRPGAHIAFWNRRPRWNEEWRGHQWSTSWGQISHYLPHKPSWCEAKVRQAGRHSWAQRLRHPSGKWPAFDQACHFCREGDPHDQTRTTSQSLRPWQQWLTFVLSIHPPK